MKLSIVVAASDNDVIGVGNQLPWRLPDDLRRFKALTMGKPVIMGRKTFESIGRPLPGRTNIIISRQPGLSIDGAVVVTSSDEALTSAGAASEAMLIGGAQIYRLLLPLTDTIHMTRVHTTLPGDAYFPVLDGAEWREVDSEPHAADDRHEHSFTFITLQRIRS